MIITILIVLGIIVFTIVGGIKSKNSWNFDIVEIFLFDLIGVVLLFVAIIVSVCLAPNTVNQAKYKLVNTNKIIALQDNITGEGSTTYLGAGHYEDNLNYFYATNTNMGVKIEKVQADFAYVQYSNTPKIETYKVTGFNKWTTYLYAYPCYEIYKIYVPKGTIQQNYNIDLK